MRGDVYLQCLFVLLCVGGLHAQSTITDNNLGNVQAIILALNASSDVITATLPNFHHYTYDGSSTSISDGGGDMYDGGNEVQVLNGFDVVTVTYGFNDTFGNDEYQAANIPGHPFQLGIWIDNERRNLNTLQIRVTSNFGADGSGSATTQSGNVELGNFQLTYKARQIYNAGDPSVLEVYYVVNNTQQWSSNTEWSFTLTVRSSGTQNGQNTAMLSSMSNVFFGYTLLSARNGRFTSDTELAAVMREYLQIISNISVSHSQVQQSLKAISNYSEQITCQVPNFYKYNYDSVDQISDGGFDMYDGGNQIYFGKGQQLVKASYNQTFSFQDYTFSTLATYPFTALMWVDGNTDGQNYTIEVRSNAGADGAGRTARNSGWLYPNGYVIHFESFQIYGTQDPTICEVYFQIENNAWGSNFRTRVILQILGNDQNNVRNHASISSTSRAMFGYMLLSKRDVRGDLISENEIRNSLYEMVNLIAGPGHNLPTPFPMLPKPNVDSSTTAIPATTTVDQQTTAATTTTTNFATVKAIVLALNASSDVIRATLPDFYNYTYDGTQPTSIGDGGNDMYDVGNEIQVLNGTGSVTVNYGFNNTFGNDVYQAANIPGHPFQLGIWVGNERRTLNTLQIRVTSDFGADGSGAETTQSGNVELENFQLTYKARQIYNAGDPSVLEVYYVVNNTQQWSSNTDWSFTLTVGISGTARDQNTATLNSMSNVFFGYTLLSARNGRFTSNTELAAVMREYLQIISNISDSSAYVERSVQAISNFNQQITDQVPDFYNYIYDSVDQISDGGNDMYDGGNQIYFGQGRSLQRAVYNRTYSLSGHSFATSAIHPFTALMWVTGNERSDNYTIEVGSNLGSDGNGLLTRFSGSLYLNNYLVMYRTFQVHGAFDPTVCEVFFLISSPTVLQSSFNPSLNLEVTTTNQNGLINRANVPGSTRNTMFGYLLLSRKNGKFIPELVVRNTIYEATNLIMGPGFGLTTPFPPLPLPNNNTTSSSTTEAVTGSPATTAASIYPQVQQSLSAISNYSEQITCQVPNFYKYNYDSVNQISDGGFDMYDGGNQIYFGKGQQLFRASYNQTSNFGDYTFSTLATYPFTALMWIDGNTNGQNYTIEVRSDAGADGSGLTARNAGWLFPNGYVIHFESFQIYGTQDPTICEVYFQIEHSTWRSNFRTRVILQILGNGQNNLRNHASVSSTSRAMFGYMLLSKRDVRGDLITENEIRNSLYEMVNLIAGPGHNLPTPFPMLPKPNVDSSTTAIPATTTVDQQTTAATTVHPQVQQSLSAISNYSEQITCQVPNFYKYNYDSVNQISDGGFDMYDGGNQIYFGKGSQLNRAYYNQTSNFGDYTFSTLATYPFTALMWIDGNTDGQNYTIEVRSNTGADGFGRTARNSSSLFQSGYVVHFESFQIYGTQDPTICEVYFQIESFFWQSSFRSRIILQLLSNNQDNLRNHASISSTSRAMFGYMLLSKTTGIVTNSEIQNALQQTVNIIAGPGHNQPTPFPFLPKPMEPQTTAATSTQPSTTPLPTTPPTPTPVADVAFLPSCTLKQAIRSIWACENLFTNNVPYSDPQVCSLNINNVLHCVANKLQRCSQGPGINVFQRFGIPFNVQHLINTIRSFTSSISSCHSSNPVTEFCKHGSFSFFFSPYQFGSPPPHSGFGPSPSPPFPGSPPHPGYGPSPPHPGLGGIFGFPICNSFSIQSFIYNASQYYYNYVGARSKQEICVIFRNLRDDFIRTARNNCSLMSLYPLLSSVHPDLYEYTVQATDVALNEISRFEISACPRNTTRNNQTRVQTDWLRSYIRWRSTHLPRWQKSFNKWLETGGSAISPLPQLPPCLDLTQIKCKHASQFVCNSDVNQCQFCYCLDHLYKGLTAELMEPWKKDFYNWESFTSKWEMAFDEYETNNEI